LEWNFFILLLTVGFIYEWSKGIRLVLTFAFFSFNSNLGRKSILNNQLQNETLLNAEIRSKAHVQQTTFQQLNLAIRF
jgi:hypothetical protein